ncbi:membrane protein [Streptomyces sp. Tu 6176]|uniref:hypothetical protein n=1 Tax=Streptomyces sp. Tu 6176 TaxID=1470557 RepID=UPI0004518FD9|nr:hypothetical protein [Streptomyces sp. Tu 6176]EYT83863.1 membrane protein [Streptomyces sp. Tu 6176]
MIVGLIVACEAGFWVLLAAGLAVRYLLGRRRLGAALLLAEPLLEVVLFAVTAVDLRNGAEPGWEHGLAALYIGFTVAYGHSTVRWLDGHAAHRLGGAPRPPKPPRYGLARARHEGRLWLRTLLASAVALALLQAAIWYVGGGAGTDPLRAWQTTVLRILVIHGLIALTYLVFPKKGPKTPEAVPRAASPEGEPPAEESPAEASPAGEGTGSLSARRPAPTARHRSPCSPSGRE